MIKDWIKSRLSFMLLKYILITSSFFTCMSTIVQVYIEYSSDLGTIQKSVEQIESSYSSSLANSLWHLDNDQMHDLLTGILKLRDIEYIRISEKKTSGDTIFMEVGDKAITRKIEQSFSLTYGKDNKQSVIGSVIIHANLDFLYDRILDKIFLILITQTIKTFLVSFIILFIIYLTIAKKIITIAKFAEDLTHANIDQEIVIPKTIIDEENEIDDLVTSINRMRLNLKNYIKNRDDAERQLTEYKSHLEDLVLKRTKQLNNKNLTLEQKIDEINKMQQHLISQEKLASLGNLTSGIAHEINNPLNFVINFAQVADISLNDLLQKIEKIEDTTEIQDEAKEIQKMIFEINKHGKRAEQIIKSMLSHSRSDSENMEKELININNVINENLNFAFHAMRAKYRGFNVNIIKEFEDENTEIHIVAADMARVFLNIFSNSFYSMIKKSDERNNVYDAELLIKTELKNEKLLITIRDNGLGIESEKLAKIFTPFFTTKPTGEGTGLGLSLCYDIVTGLHGGNITVTSTKDEFAQFTITLPV